MPADGGLRGVTAACAGHACQVTGCIRALVEEDLEGGLVEHRDTELLGLVGLGAGAVAHDDEVGLLRHRAGSPPAAGLDGRRGPVTGEVLQRAGHDDGQALERTGPIVAALLLEADAGGAPLLDDLPVPVDVPPLARGRRR